MKSAWEKFSEGMKCKDNPKFREAIIEGSCPEDYKLKGKYTNAFYCPADATKGTCYECWDYIPKITRDTEVQCPNCDAVRKVKEWEDYSAFCFRQKSVVWSWIDNDGEGNWLLKCPACESFGALSQVKVL